MGIPYVYSTCWHMKLMFYEHQHLVSVAVRATCFLSLKFISSSMGATWM
jgi:hypothetical protein